MTLIATIKRNSLKSTLSPTTSSASIAAKRVIKPLTVGSSKRPRNYNKNVNSNKITTLVQTLYK
jgi:hypothetical protein